MEDPCPWPQGQGAWLRWAVKSGISSSPSLPALPLLYFVPGLHADIPTHSRVTLTRALRRENSCCDPLTPWLWWVTQLPPATWVSMSGFLDSLGHTVCTLNCWILIKAGYRQLGCYLWGVWLPAPHCVVSQHLWHYCFSPRAKHILSSGKRSVLNSPEL